jgi:hypothetical protein
MLEAMLVTQIGGMSAPTCSLNGVVAAASKAPVLIKTREGEGREIERERDPDQSALHHVAD